MNKLFILRCCSVVFVLLLLTGSADAQTKKQLKSDAETQLQTMTPEQIEAKIREFGMTRSEAVQRARELGISLEDFIQNRTFSPALDDRTDVLSGMVASDSTGTDPSVQYIKKRKKLEKIPEFHGRMGIDSTIQPFGYEIFQYPSSTFKPSMNVATSPSYLLGIGDEIILSVWGETKLSSQLTVNKDGNIVISDVGPIGAVGITVQQLKDRLLKRMTAVYASLRNGARDATSFLDVSIGKVKTSQVFVLGEVEQPGGYSLSSLSTVMQALYLAGGPMTRGSLREVQLRRDGKLFRNIDLYEYILKGDNSKDVHLQDGDIIFVPPVADRVAIVGTLFRPGIYELRPKESLRDLLQLSGGLVFESYVERVHIERIVPFSKRTESSKNVQDIDLLFTSADALLKSSYGLVDGDIVTIRKINKEFRNRAAIYGSVRKPGIYELTKDLTVRDLIINADSLDGVTFPKGLIFRMLPNKKRQVLSFDPNQAMVNDMVHNVILVNEDSIIVYRDSLFNRPHTVTISGAVHYPGTYIRSENLSVTDLIVTAGGLTVEASTENIEVSSIDTSSVNMYAVAEKISIPKNYWEVDSASEYRLRDFDFVLVPRRAKFGAIKTVSVTGMVRYPGSYTVQTNTDRISNIIQRAGGIKEGAYIEAGEFYRASKNTGRIPLDMKNAIEDEESPDNLLVDGGDSIHIGQREDIVFVRGEVFVPSPVIYKEGASIEYYIDQAGGFTEEAYEDGAVAFLPTGKKWESGGFLSPDPEIMPGSVVMVPKKVEKPDTVFPYIRDIVTILASLAAITVGVASIAR